MKGLEDEMHVSKKKNKEESKTLGFASLFICIPVTRHANNNITTISTLERDVC
jgi:hypothetical protein